MTSETPSYDILEQFKNTSNKVKKRFLRKPNITEASESFSTLGLHCESIELPAYAGLCWVAAARCEGSLANIPGETSCLIRSARQFLKAEETDSNLGCYSPSLENLQAGLSCYVHASGRFNENCPIPIGLNLEIVDFLKRIDRSEYAKTYLQTAIELSEGRPDTKTHCLELLANNFIHTGDYVGALEVFTEISTILEQLPENGARSELLLKCEICSVFLLLILRPSPQKLTPRYAKLLEKYTWGDESDKSLKVCKMTEKMFLLMQSLVTICQSLDTSNLLELEGEFWPYLTPDSKQLLRTLVKLHYP